MKSFNVIVPPGRLWVMGDNRAISDDSRGHMSGSPDMGTVPENEVAGRAFMIIWPPSQLGDLPIPATFQQAALHAGEAAAAVTAVPAVGAAALLGIPVLALRTLRARRAPRVPRVRARRRGRLRGCAGARR